MTELDLDAIEQGVNAVTEGPWEAAHETFAMASIRAPRNTPRGWVNVAQVKHSHGPADAEFIAHARTDVPALVAEVRRLRDSLATSGRIYLRASQATTKALGLDPDDGDSCVPGCDEGPAGVEHDIWHLTQQRDDATRRAERAEQTWVCDSCMGTVVRWQIADMADGNTSSANGAIRPQYTPPTNQDLAEEVDSDDE